MELSFTTVAGTELTAPSVEALARGCEWHDNQRTTVADMIAFCAAHGVDLTEGGSTLRKDWAHVAVYTYATHVFK